MRPPSLGGGFVRYQLGRSLSDEGESWTKTGEPRLPLGGRDDFHVPPALPRDPAGNLAKAGELWHLVHCGNPADDVEHATRRSGSQARSPLQDRMTPQRIRTP